MSLLVTEAVPALAPAHEEPAPQPADDARPTKRTRSSAGTPMVCHHCVSFDWEMGYFAHDIRCETGIFEHALQILVLWPVYFVLA
jgi:hypothetical protein